MLIHEFMCKIGNMQFYMFDDLYSKKEEVRNKFQTLNAEEKMMYKWFYFQQTCHLNIRIKESMWDYITGVISKKKIEKEYAIYCKKKEEQSIKGKNRMILGNI